MNGGLLARLFTYSAFPFTCYQPKCKEQAQEQKCKIIKPKKRNRGQKRDQFRVERDCSVYFLRFLESVTIKHPCERGSLPVILFYFVFFSQHKLGFMCLVTSIIVVFVSSFT